MRIKSNQLSTEEQFAVPAIKCKPGTPLSVYTVAHFALELARNPYGTCDAVRFDKALSVVFESLFRIDQRIANAYRDRDQI